MSVSILISDSKTSGPYRISWNITGPSHTNDTSVVYHGFVETDDCRQGFWYIFRSPGHYILSTTIENDVDAVDNEFSIHAVQRNAGWLNLAAFKILVKNNGHRVIVNVD